MARAAAARGTAMGLSSFASKPIEQVVAANPKTSSRVYWIGGRDEMIRRVERARAAGAVGLILTLDWSFSHSRDWGSPRDPRAPHAARTASRLAPQGLARPRWLLRYARSRPPARPRPCPTWPTGQAGADVLRRLRRSGCRPRRPTWEDVAWLRAQWDGPFLLKGVIRVDEAKRAVDAGVSAISVSNHGGNNLDGTPATIRALPAIADAVGDQVEVAARRRHPPRQRRRQGPRPRRAGRTDRPRLPVGPRRERPGGRARTCSTSSATASTPRLLALGRRSVHDLGPSDVVLPPRFAVVLGADRDTVTAEP